MDKERGEIRFKIKSEIYKKLVERARLLDIPLASYLKANLEKWGEVKL